MSVTVGSLAHAFVEDHRVFTRELVRLKEALQRRDWPEARRVADRLDLAAGPHIAFEERELYPLLGRIRGKAFADAMYAEHQEGASVIRALAPARPDPDEPEAQLLVEHANTMLDHAVRCGSLLSYVNTLDQTEQARLLDRLLACRKQPLRWSELSPPAQDAPSPPA